MPRAETSFAVEIAGGLADVVAGWRTSAARDAALDRWAGPAGSGGADDYLPEHTLISALIDWEGAPNRLLTGDLSTQGALVAEWIRAPASCDEVIEPARAARADPLLLVTALPGWAQRDNNR